MPASNDLSPVFQRILAAAAGSDNLRQFLVDVLPESRAALGVAAFAVVRANPPKWEVQGASGANERELPLELIADAVDKDRQTASGEWTAAPLGDGYALAARRLDSALMARFTEAL